MKLCSDSDILRYANRVAVEKGVRITPTVCAIYIALVHLFFSVGTYDEKSKMYYLQYSSRELSNVLQFSFSTLCSALQKLHECGLIVRVPVKRDFHPLKDGKFLTNKPNITFLDLSPFLNEEL